jgi:histidine triad (HIT) family protein
MSECLFCKIVNKEIESKIVYEDEDSMAFLDIYPHAPGHTVLIPKKHRYEILELEEYEASKLFLALKKTLALIQNAIKPDGFTIGINHGETAGQVIPHLHIHLIPRFKEDGGGSIHSVVLNKPKESIDEIYNKIKKHGN